MIDIAGQRFGRLVVLFATERKDYGFAYWQCRCDCGEVSEVRSYSLRKGGTKSCGCIARVKSRQRLTTHGQAQGKRTAEYRAWHSMKDRCFCVNNKSYSYYGGRGITVCDRWRNSFENFFEDMGKKPRKDLSLDRVDNNGNYAPNNCRWATHSEQQSNKRYLGRSDHK